MQSDGNATADNITVGNIEHSQGVAIGAGATAVVGYTADQVSALVAKIGATFQPKPFDGRSPYVGLAAFQEKDADRFFGREKLVDELVARVNTSRAIFIAGPSGSGKSSLARAGLIHALKAGALAKSEIWLYETMQPSRAPLDELSRVVSRWANSLSAGDDIRAKGLNDPTILQRWADIALSDARDRRAILLVDQFEEIFTQVSHDDERIAFLNLLTHAATVENGRVTILFALRSDFVSHCAAYPQLNALLNQQFLQVGAMTPDELVSAIAQPALRFGLRIDPDLIAQIVNEMRDAPNALPLMQFALDDLFAAQRAKGGIIALTLQDYLARGGLQKALERHADAAFARLSADEQTLARAIFAGVIEIGRGTVDTRRTALFDELVPAGAGAAQVERVVQKLADARLIATDEREGKETVTLAHERLIDAWQWLRRLVNENREAIALQNEMAQDAREWDANQRDASYLYTGARLATVREQLDAKKIVLSGLAQNFVEAGIRANEADRRARRRRLQVTIAGLVTALLLISALALVALQQSSTARSEANARATEANARATAEAKAIADRDAAEQAKADALKQKQISDSRRVATQSMLNRDQHFDLALLLGVEALRLDNNLEVRGNLLDALTSKSKLVSYLRGQGGSVYSIAFSPDGKMIASGGWYPTAGLWDVENRQFIAQLPAGRNSSVNNVAFSPDGQILASAGDDNIVVLWNMKTRQLIGQPLTGSQIAFSPDGKTLASVNSDYTIWLWDLNSPQPTAQLLGSHKTYVHSITFSPDGKMLASASSDQTIILWDVNKRQAIGQPLTGHTYGVNSVAFSPDGKTLASGSDDNTILVWDVSTHGSVAQPLTGHNSPVESVVFSPDGTMIASADNEGVIILWNATTHQSIRQLIDRPGATLRSIAFSPDGKLLASEEDGNIVLWNTTALPAMGQMLTGHTSYGCSVAFSPDGKTLATGDFNGNAILWDVRTRQAVGSPLAGHEGQGQVFSVSFSPDGKTLASGSYDTTIILWDVATRQRIGQPLTGHTKSVQSVAFSPDGKTLASGSYDTTIILWDTATRQRIGQPLTGHTGGVKQVSFSPDGKILASASNTDNDATVFLWNLSTRKPIGQINTGLRSVDSIAFSPDGKMLASASNSDSLTLLWDVITQQQIGRIQTRLAGLGLAFSPDGKTLASGGSGDNIILSDIGTRQPIGQELLGHTDNVNALVFSPDGKTLASVSSDEKVILWDVDPESWKIRACKIANRNITRAEWAQFIDPDPSTYRATCPGLPLEPAATPTPKP